MTHQQNYRSVSQWLGRSDELVHDPDALLDPRTAYDAMSVGMGEGLFTRRILAEFISDTTLDYVNARRIVNPGDRGDVRPDRVEASLR